MSVSDKERARRRRESRRRAHRGDIIAAVVLIVVVAIAVIGASVAIAHANGNEEDTMPSATKRTTTTTTTTTTLPSSTTTTASSSTTTTTTTATTGNSSSSTTAGTTAQNTGSHYVQPAGAAWNLLLVNDWNTMPQASVDALKLKVINQSVVNGSVDERIADPLNKMISACRKAGGNIWAQSMYRPYEIQKSLYWKEVDYWKRQGLAQAEAEDKAATIVKRPGQSEHNTGLAVDFNNCDESFTGTTAYNWLLEHCHEYGFILRFPQGKEDVTGVVFESWHYRYVGVEAATEIMRDGITLEEYCQRHGV